MLDILLVLIPFLYSDYSYKAFFLCVNVSVLLLYFVTNSSIHICFMRGILFIAFIVPGI